MTNELVIGSGASSGLGAALVDRYTRDAEYIDISRRGGHPAATHLAADLATEHGWNAAANLFVQSVAGFDGGRITFIHNARTLTPIGFAGEVDASAYRRNVLLNSAAPQVLGDAFLRPAQDTSASCDLVMIGSGAATSAYPGWTSYRAAKAAMAQWVRSAGLEQDARPHANRVVWIAPGVVATPMQTEIRSTPDADFPRSRSSMICSRTGISARHPTPQTRSGRSSMASSRTVPFSTFAIAPSGVSLK